MKVVVAWALLILFLEFRRLNNHFQTPAEQQNYEKEKIMVYIDQMRNVLGSKAFTYITILSSLLINGLYIVYFFLSTQTINFETYKIITSILLVDRIFKFSDTLDIDFEKIDYIVGSDAVIGIRSSITILHILVTLFVIVLN